MDADLTFLSLRKKTRLREKDIKSLSKNSPFLDQSFRGAVVGVMIAGNVHRMS
jgi:dihydroorotase-like cyclic amidohydrolase